MATNKCTTEIQSIKHRANNIGIPEAYSRTNIYNDNTVAVQWVASVTSKWIKHLNLWENMVQGCHQSKDVDVEHIPDIINPRDIFTKKMKNNTHFRNIRDSMMVSIQAFLKYNHNVPTHIIPTKKHPSLLFHKVEKHSPRKSRTVIGGQTDRIKRSSINFSWQGGVEGSRVKWILIITSVRHPPLRTYSIS